MPNNSLHGTLRPVLDPDFQPAVLWNKAYRKRCAGNPDSTELGIALSRPDGTVFAHRTPLLPHTGGNIPLNNRYVDRLVKFLLWQEGGSAITVGGNDAIAETLRTASNPWNSDRHSLPKENRP